MLDFHVPYNHKFCFINVHGQFVRLAPFIDFLQCFLGFFCYPGGIFINQCVSSAYINAELSGSMELKISVTYRIKIRRPSMDP